MIKYTIEIEGDFMTFVGAIGSPKEGERDALKKALIKKVSTIDTNEFIMLVSIDNNTNAYSFNEVEDPGTGSAFISLDAFRDYIIVELSNV